MDGKTIHTEFYCPFNLSESLNCEWLETNGSGAYASSTILECHTRKYHGLFVTPLKEQEGRFVILSSVEPSFILKNKEYKLGTNIYPGTIYPEGYKNLISFSLFPMPSWIYKFDEIQIKREIFMVKGESALYTVHTLEEGAEELPLYLKILFSFRNSHALTDKWSIFTLEPLNCENSKMIKILPSSSMPPVNIEFSGEYHFQNKFYRDNNIEYPMEKERGFDFQEDRFVPGITSVILKKGIPFILKFSIYENVSKYGDLDSAYKKEKAKRKKAVSNLNTKLDVLKHSSADFMIGAKDGKKSVIAGFPWFGEWGRDTMIALPGLTFCKGNINDGIKVLKYYLSKMQNGIIPNTIGDIQGFTSYNAADTSLLFFRTLQFLIEVCEERKPNDVKKIKSSFFQPMLAIVSAFLNGKVSECKVLENGLLETGTCETQLTWMDAKAWGKPVTPRNGLAVEQNALWFNALSMLSEFSAELKKKIPEAVNKILKNFPETFISTFYIKNEGFLTDTVLNGIQDKKLRPNMLFASALKYPLLPKKIIAEITDTASRELLTPFGLRTLSPGDPDFTSKYEGDGNTRDSQYHQGTVWPWLIGIMIESSLKGADNIKQEIEFWEKYLDTFLENHLFKNGIAHISEIFDGISPSGEMGKGCFAQAWSTGEIIRSFYILDKAKKESIRCI